MINNMKFEPINSTDFALVMPEDYLASPVKLQLHWLGQQTQGLQPQDEWIVIFLGKCGHLQLRYQQLLLACRLLWRAVQPSSRFVL